MTAYIWIRRLFLISNHEYWEGEKKYFNTKDGVAGAEGAGTALPLPEVPTNSSCSHTGNIENLRQVYSCMNRIFCKSKTPQTWPALTWETIRCGLTSLAGITLKSRSSWQEPWNVEIAYILLNLGSLWFSFSPGLPRPSWGGARLAAIPGWDPIYVKRILLHAILSSSDGCRESHPALQG